MFTQLSQRIRKLTLQAETSVERKEIELCLALLVERQNLLEQFKAQFLAKKHDPELSKAFTSLLQWIQQQDVINNAKVVKYREASKQKSVTQAKTKKALHHYKNVT